MINLFIVSQTSTIFYYAGTFFLLIAGAFGVGMILLFISEKIIEKLIWKAVDWLMKYLMGDLYKSPEEFNINKDLKENNL